MMRALEGAVLECLLFMTNHVTKATITPTATRLPITPPTMAPVWEPPLLSEPFAEGKEPLPEWVEVDETPIVVWVDPVPVDSGKAEEMWLSDKGIT